MTLQQLKYVTAVAETGTISGAAQALFLSQPSLTAAIHDLEQELNITIFSRTNRGVALTPAGDEFLGYARQVLEQTDLIEERYTGSAPRRHRFSVSTQHYSFAVEAFVDLLQEHGGPEYDFCIRETKTYEIIEDVARLRSEVGVLYLNAFNTRCSPGSSGSTSWSSTPCSPPAPTCSSARPIPWPAARPSPWTTWPPIPGCPMSRGSTTPSTSPRRS